MLEMYGEIAEDVEGKAIDTAKKQRFMLLEVKGDKAEKLHEASFNIQGLVGYKKFCSMYIMENILTDESYDRYKCFMQTKNWRRNVEFDFYATHADVNYDTRKEFVIVKSGSEAAKLWGME